MIKNPAAEAVLPALREFFSEAEQIRLASEDVRAHLIKALESAQMAFGRAQVPTEALSNALDSIAESGKYRGWIIQLPQALTRLASLPEDSKKEASDIRLVTDWLKKELENGTIPTLQGISQDFSRSAATPLEEEAIQTAFKKVIGSPTNADQPWLEQAMGMLRSEGRSEMRSPGPDQTAQNPLVRQLLEGYQDYGTGGASITDAAEYIKHHAVSLRTSEQLTAGILRLWLALNLMGSGLAERFSGSLSQALGLAVPLAYADEAAESQLDLLLASSERPRFSDDLVVKVENQMGAILDQGRFVYRGAWVDQLQGDSEALFNLFNAIEKLRAAGVTEPVIGIVGSKDAFVGAAAQTLANKNNLSPMEKQEAIRLLNTRITQMIHFIEPADSDDAGASRALAAYVAAGRGHYGVTVLDDQLNYVAGAVNLNLTRDKVHPRDLRVLLPALSLNGLVAAVFANSVAAEEIDETLAQKLVELFNGAQLHFENRIFVFRSIGQYLQNLFDAAVIIAQSA
jgi:hypothetical protein